MYWSRKAITEFYRAAVTRIRPSFRGLAMETGRWSRLPREKRKCTCGEIHTERHIVNECVRARDVRTMYDGVSSYPLLFHESDMSKVAKFLYECLGVFE